VDALSRPRDELPRDRAAEDFVDDLQAGPPFLLARRRIVLQRLDAQEHLAELPGAAGLLLVAVVAVGLLQDRLAVGDLRRLGVDVEARVLQLFKDEPQVQLAEPCITISWVWRSV
jgi:hypothetical protein